jgi:hypothetical protein
MAFLGSKLTLLFAAPAGDRIVVEASPAAAASLRIGERTTLAWAPTDTLLFPEVE